MNKKIIIYAIVSIITTLISLQLINAGGNTNWILSGDNVYINNSQAYINAYPHTITQDNQLVEIDFMSKSLSGNFNIGIGINNTENNWMKLKQLSIVNFYINTTSNGTNETIVNETIIQTTNISYDYDGKNLWIVGTNIPINANQMYKLRIIAEKQGEGKYDIAGWQSTRTMDWALSHSQFIYIDPWYNVSGTANYSTINLSYGVISYWAFDNNAIDSLGRANGTINNALNVTSKIKQGYNFNGTRRLNITFTNYITWGDKRTISFWARSTGGINYRAVYHEECNSGQSHSIYYDTNNKYHYYGGASGDGPVTDAVANNTWVHVVATYNGTLRKIYLNGYLNGTHTNTFANCTSTAHVIGANKYDQNFIGDIDEIGVWNRELSADEILLLYSIQKDGNPQGRYPFNISYTLPNNVTIIASSPNNQSYTYKTTPNMYGNVTSISGNWNISLFMNGVNKGTYENVSGVVNFNITSSTLTAGEYNWSFRATDNSDASNIVNSNTMNIYIAGNTTVEGNASVLSCLVVTNGCSILSQNGCNYVQ